MYVTNYQILSLVRFLLCLYACAVNVLINDHLGNAYAVAD
jgi:hypothetical protein